MSSTDEERLVVLLEARIRDLERNMAKASGITAKTYREMSLGSKRATKNMEQDMVRSTTRINQALAHTSTKIGTFGKAMIGGFVGGLAAGGIAGVVNQVREVANAVAEVGDQARMAGLSTKVFQEWKFVAEQARIPIDAITDGLKEMQLRADEFAVTGTGSAAEAFQRLGLTPQEIKEKLKDPSELLLLIIERTRQMRDTAAGIRIFDELFGGSGGERMVALLEQGEGGIRAQIDAANDLGIVMDDELIKKAAEIDRRFNLIAGTVGTTLKSAIVSAADSLMEFVDGFRDFQNQRTGTLQNRQATIGLRLLDLENQRMQTPDTEAMVLRKIDQQIKDLQKEDAQITREIGTRVGPMNRTADRTWTPPEYTPPADTTSKAGKSRSSSVAAAERERKAVQELIAELEEELRLVNATDAQKRASIASRQAGAAATDAERQKIIDLTEAIHQEEEARRRAEEQAFLYRDVTRAAIDDVLSGIEQNKSAFEIMGDVAVNALKRIADTLIDDVLDSLFKVNSAAGSGGGLFGTLLGGLFGGGAAAADPWSGMRIASAAIGSSPSTGGSMANVPRPQTMNLPRGSQVQASQRSGGRSTNGGPSQAVHVTSEVKVSVDDDGNLKAYVAKTSQEQTTGVLKEWVRGNGFTQNVADAFNDARSRRMVR
jgi:hypothetical protein